MNLFGLDISLSFDELKSVELIDERSILGPNLGRWVGLLFHGLMLPPLIVITDCR